jgi:hypothetical protein
MTKHTDLVEPRPVDVLPDGHLGVGRWCRAPREMRDHPEEGDWLVPPMDSAAHDWGRLPLGDLSKEAQCESELR